MYNTYKLMCLLDTGKYENLTLNDLAIEYQKLDSSEILAKSFIKIYKLAITVSNKFWGLCEEDIASYCLEKLLYCLKTYDNSYGQFTTYFCRVFSNKLREETENLNRKKRKCLLTSINELINVGVEDTYNLIEMLLPNDLTEREKQLCILESEGYDRKYCSEVLGVSRMTISNMEKSLRIKLSCLQNC